MFRFHVSEYIGEISSYKLLCRARVWCCSFGVFPAGIPDASGRDYIPVVPEPFFLNLFRFFRSLLGFCG